MSLIELPQQKVNGGVPRLEECEWSTAEVLDAFDEFWKWYPRRVGKPLARAKFMAICSRQGLLTRTLDKDSGTYVDIHLRASPEELVEAAKRMLRESIDPKTGRVRDDGKFIPHPATYLNQGRFEDG